MVKLRYKDALKINWLLGLMGQPNEFITNNLKNKSKYVKNKIKIEKFI